MGLKYFSLRLYPIIPLKCAKSLNCNMTSKKSEYEWAIKLIDNLGIKIESVAEIGSRDALDAIYLSKVFKCSVSVFEPDPVNAIVCKENIIDSSLNKFISFYEIALSDKDANLDFYSIDRDLYSNNGAGGLFRINFSNRYKSDPDHNRPTVQRLIRVQGQRYDSLAIPPPILSRWTFKGVSYLF